MGGAESYRARLGPPPPPVSHTAPGPEGEAVTSGIYPVAAVSCFVEWWRASVFAFYGRCRRHGDRYPQCLHMLELLQYEHFRKELVNAQCAKFIDEQQILHWQHYSRKRMRLQQALAEQQQQNNTSGK
nr:mediator of RNA polymerase II transcription subunit 31 isoform X2 [Loxodonta africana]